MAAAKHQKMTGSGPRPFDNLSSIMGDTTVEPVSDFFDGADLETVNERVGGDLDNVIILTKNVETPIAPNSFL